MKGLSVIVVLASAVAMAGALPTAQVSKYTLPTKQMCLNRFSNTDKDHRVVVHASCLQYGIFTGYSHGDDDLERAVAARDDGPVLTDLVSVAVGGGNVANTYDQCSGDSPVLSGAVNVAAAGGKVTNNYDKGDGVLDGLVNVGVLGGSVTNSYDSLPDCSSPVAIPVTHSAAFPEPSSTTVASYPSTTSAAKQPATSAHTTHTEICSK